ncbi:MAG: FHA domain-containing protein [Thermoleophilia bacterium]|nr:FHA domain-containing protein [Thermoleophilia bacterium]
MSIQQLLLGGQVVVIALVYVFVWRVMRTAARDVARGGSSGSANVSTRSAGTSAPGRAAGAAVGPAMGDAGESTIIPAAQAAQARRAAGLGEPRVVVVSSDNLRPGVPFVLEGSGLTVGRADDNDIVLDDPSVSGHHARLLPPGVVHDLDSTNGTIVAGGRISARRNLRAGDTIVIGATTFRFEVAAT